MQINEFLVRQDLKKRDVSGIWWARGKTALTMINNLVPRVLYFPSPGTREGREGGDPGNEVA